MVRQLNPPKKKEKKKLASHSKTRESVAWDLVYSSVLPQAEASEAGDHLSHPGWAEVQRLLQRLPCLHCAWAHL